MREDPLFRTIDGIIASIVDGCHDDLASRSVSRAKSLERRLTERESGKVKVDAARRAEQLTFMLERIEHWLHVAGFHAAQAEEQIRDLYAGFEELAAYDRAWFEASSEYVVQELDEMEVVELVPADPAALSALDASLEPLLDGLRAGTWVEFVMDGEPRNRCKLSMVFEQSRNHLFVDHRGPKVCEADFASSFSIHLCKFSPPGS